MLCLPSYSNLGNTNKSWRQIQDLLTNYHSLRAVDKRGYLMVIEEYFFLFLIETICCVDETIQIRVTTYAFMQD